MEDLNRHGAAKKRLAKFHIQKRRSENLNELNGLKDKFLQLHRIQQLQKSILRQNMHNAMSPLSAIAGYLDLIDMSLHQEADVNKLSYYRKKIETGVKEVNEILEQLQEVYKKEDIDYEDAADDLLDVDLNWMSREVFEEMKCKRDNITFEIKYHPLHIKTDLYITKLIIFKVIRYATKCSSKKDEITLFTNKENEMATFSASFKVSASKRKEIEAVLKATDKDEKSVLINENSMNEGLLVSNQLVQQMNGFIELEDIDGDYANLKLSLPLSEI